MGMHKENKKWFALYTRFKSEKIAHQYFSKTGIHSYVPTLQKTKQYKRKIKHYDIPIISCYVFVNIQENDKVQALQNPYVIHFVNIGGEVTPIPEKEIDLLKKITGELNEVEVARPDMYKLGDEVEVIRGKLTGLRGKVVENRGKQDIVIELGHIGIQLKIQIDPMHIRRIKKAIKKPGTLPFRYSF